MFDVEHPRLISSGNSPRHRIGAGKRILDRAGPEDGQGRPDPGSGRPGASPSILREIARLAVERPAERFHDREGRRAEGEPRSNGLPIENRRVIKSPLEPVRFV
jgi:hypothetical protein